MENNHDDLTSQPFPDDLKWSNDDATTSLKQLYHFVNNECDQAIRWYFNKKQTKKIFGYVFRIGAIIAVAISGIIPILGEILETGGVPMLSPGWATVALGLAALFISLDRFGGYTSGWIRYIRTGQALNKLQSDFRIEWEKQMLILQADQSNLETVRQAVDKCKKFLAQVNAVICAETDQWAQDFQKILHELEEDAKEKNK
jgi:hypothetical protein